MTMKNDAKFEEKLICRFKIDIRILTNFDTKIDTSNWRILTRILTEIYTLMDSFWSKYIMLELKSTEELCLITLKIDAKFEGKLTCAFKNDMSNLANFHRLKNGDFILESKIAELNQNEKSKQPDRLDAVGKVYFTLEINEYHNQQNFLHMFYKIIVLKEYKKISKKFVN